MKNKYGQAQPINKQIMRVGGNGALDTVLKFIDQYFYELIMRLQIILLKKNKNCSKQIYICHKNKKTRILISTNRSVIVKKKLDDISKLIEEERYCCLENIQIFVQNLQIVLFDQSYIFRKEKQHRYRKFVIEEFINTERNYVNDLKILIVIQSQVKQWLNKQQIEIIFNNLQQLYELNSPFLQDLEGFLPYKRFKLLGPKIKGLAPFFKVYFTYYEGFNKSMATLKQLTNDKEDFRKFLKNMSSIKDYNNQDIQSYLIKPVQRIPKYNLLLDDLIKHTEKTHPDYKNLCECLDLFKKINDDNNKNMDQFLSSKLFDMEKWFGNKLNQKLVDSKRKYITELLTSILDQNNKVINVTAFILSDLQQRYYKLYYNHYWRKIGQSLPIYLECIFR